MPPMFLPAAFDPPNIRLVVYAHNIVARILTHTPERTSSRDLSTKQACLLSCAAVMQGNLIPEGLGEVGQVRTSDTELGSWALIAVAGDGDLVQLISSEAVIQDLHPHIACIRPSVGSIKPHRVGNIYPVVRKKSPLRTRTEKKENHRSRHPKVTTQM